jgi:hypothetical protein
LVIFLLAAGLLNILYKAPLFLWERDICYTSDMKLGRNVGLRKGMAAHIPWYNNNIAQGLYPNVYLPKKVFENLKSKNPDPKYIAILAHEQKHVERQKEMGPFKWGMKYVFSPKFRFDEEILAIKAQKMIDVEKSAKDLSSWIYLWMVSYKTAKEKLESGN